MVNYGEFISIFDKDYNLDYFYANFLRKKKEVEKILKEEASNNFLRFLLEKKIKKEEEIRVFYYLYNNNLDIDIIYLYYKNNSIDLNDLRKIESIDNLKYIILNKYKDYLKEDIDKIDNIDFKNIMIFISKYPKFYEKMDGNKYKGGIYLSLLDIERDLNFLKILGIEKIEGDFCCDGNKNLKTLRGCPSWVGNNFYCFDCGLEELGMQEGVRIEYNFDCSHNENLKSLKGCPSYVGGNFDCKFCNLNEIDLDSGITIEKNLYCLRGNNVTKKQVEEYIKENNINLGGKIL